MKAKSIYKIYCVIKYSLYGIAILCMCFFCYYIARRIIDKDKPSKIFGYYIVEVAPGSGSMYNPSEEYKDISLSPGDLLFIKKIPNSEYEVGMTITFYDEKGIITTHQIIKIESDTIITKGINKNNSEDEPIKYQQIIGKVDKVFKNFREKANFFVSPLGIIIVIIILVAINFTLNFLDKRLKEQVNKEENKTENIKI